MPTHQGTSQTDIIIGDGGNSITLDASFGFTATYPNTLTFLYKNHSPGADNENSSYTLKAIDSNNKVVATFSARYKVDPVTGSATNISSTRGNTFSPTPTGSATSFPSSWETYAKRNWSISSTSSGSTFAGFDCEWEFATTVGSGGSVSQSVTTQNDGTLEITLVFTKGGSTVLSVDVTCPASATATTGVTLGSVSRTDDIQP
ncbi:MAG: hypothetical protein KC431_00945 [Myxococcales bacterium]|nr:hypothetical protein [Myxococcales bacterium]